MWLTFGNIEFRDDLMSRKNTKYSGYVVTGVKKGFDGEPDEEYSKIIFEGAFTTVKQGDNSVTMSLIEFFKLCQPGDMIAIKSERAGQEKWNWKISEVENRTRPVLDAGAFVDKNTKAVSLADAELVLVSVAANAVLSSDAYKQKLSNASVDGIIAEARDVINMISQLQDSCPAGLKE